MDTASPRTITDEHTFNLMQSKVKPSESILRGCTGRRIPAARAVGGRRAVRLRREAAATDGGQGERSGPSRQGLAGSHSARQEQNLLHVFLFGSSPASTLEERFPGVFEPGLDEMKNVN